LSAWLGCHTACTLTQSKKDSNSPVCLKSRTAGDKRALSTKNVAVQEVEGE
jgi:hypothetical protein